MDKKNTVKKASALCLALALTAGATGCEFIITDGLLDLEQVVATVDISQTLKNDTDNEYIDNVADVSADVSSLIGNRWLSTEIYKRDLVASFMSSGYYYVNYYGYSYTDTFNMLMDSLINQKTLTQYAVAYYLGKENGGLSVTGGENSLEAYRTKELDAETDKTKKALLNAYPEVLTLKYFLTGGKDDAESLREYNEAVYSLMYSINSTLDSTESSLITLDEETHTHEDSRTTPTNVNTEIDEYYPIKDGKLDYGVYTGRNAKNTCGEYEAVEGSTPTTRKNAYDTFLSNLESYNLIKEGENTSDVTKLDYYYMELSGTLGQALVNKFAEEIKDEAIKNFTDDEVQNEYDKIYTGQKETYSRDTDAFETALSGLSDDSFVLYGKQGFGFVYNILLPFSDAQNLAYTAAQNKASDIKDTVEKQNAIYNARKEILKGVKGKDLRSAWFCTEEDDHYAYVASEYYNNGNDKGANTYLFFENNLVNAESKYKTLTQYAGLYPYNGKATYNETDDEWEFDAETLTIDQFIVEMESYINYTLAKAGSSAKAAKDTSWTSTYGSDNANLNYYDADETVKYDQFIYYKGAVSGLSNTSRSDYFYKDGNDEKGVNDSYAALSAVNELMFAYSTDTGCLNTYMGYSVSLYKTDFVSEFEYAAQLAARGGVGTYVVVPSDYGWHIIYCSFVYDAADGSVYGKYDPDEKEIEGTFSNLFFESMKSSAGEKASENAQNVVKNEYKGAATRYVSRYQDLLDLDNQ